VYFDQILVIACGVCVLFQDNDVTASSAAATEDVEGDEDDNDDDDGVVEAKRQRRDDDGGDNVDSSDVTDTSLSWPHCFTSDRLRDHEAVLPFER